MVSFLVKAFNEVRKGGKYYYAWIGALTVLMLVGLGAYVVQLKYGLILTSMRDQVSWGIYISNFTFLVGVAAAAVLLVIPAYIYNFKPIKEIVLFGEMMAITALVMCLLFITVDLGKPLNAWHLLPLIGKMNFPSSLLAWDVLALNGYLLINTAAVSYILYTLYHKRHYKLSVLWPIIIISIPWAVSIHTVTAFLYNGLSARPFWNASILAPRFIASALCSGPALMLITFQVVRKAFEIDVTDAAIFKIAELISYALGFNLFLFGAEAFKEFYSGSIHLAPMQYLYFGLHHKTALVPWMWMAFLFNLAAFAIFLRPKTRENYKTLNIACVMVIIAVHIEKGMGLILPGFIPDTLGEVYEYLPSAVEFLVTMGIWAFGALFYTILLKVGIPIYKGEMNNDAAV